MSFHFRKWLAAKLKETVAANFPDRPRLACHPRAAEPVVDPIQREAWHIAGRALAGGVPLSKVGPSAAVELALRRGWVRQDGEMLVRCSAQNETEIIIEET